mgnify:FL=1
MGKIRLGLIGCGGMAKSHLRGLLETSNEISVTSTCDIIPERAKEAAEIVGAEFSVTDYREMLDHVDAVLISLPHDLHFETGMFFLEGGKHVLMEKPMCNTEDECIRLIEAAEKSKKVLMTAYPVRYWPIVMKKIGRAHV